jgi:Ni2+-binding GTPase involved in maturation of urease and hydrogenase
MFNAVKKDGLVLVDFVNRNDAIRSIDSKRDEVIEVGDVTFTINRSYTAQRFVKKITIDDQGKQSCFEESLNSFTLEEMNEIFSASGLTLLETFGNYQLLPYDPETSTRMILVFKK